MPMPELLRGPLAMVIAAEAARVLVGIWSAMRERHHMINNVCEPHHAFR
jgi:hypothetical protein